LFGLGSAANNYANGDTGAAMADLAGVGVDVAAVLVPCVPTVGAATNATRRVGGKIADAASDARATNRIVSFDDAATSAANRLGFDPSDVTVTDGVADVPIIFTSSVSPSDITRVTRTLQEQGVSSVRINSGPIINETITPRLARVADEGRTFMGFNVVRTGDPENMFVLERSLQ
jgi:hypothetical protein